MSRWVIVIGLLTLVVGIGGAGYGVWTIWNQHHVITSARPVRAKVVDHRTKDLKASGFVAKVPLVKYEYTVNQQPYTCETVTPAELMLPNTWAESVFKQFPIGAADRGQIRSERPQQGVSYRQVFRKALSAITGFLGDCRIGIGRCWRTVDEPGAPTMTPTKSGAMALGAKQHHLTRARVLGIVGIIGFVCGAPAILHHLMVSTRPMNGWDSCWKGRMESPC